MMNQTNNAWDSNLTKVSSMGEISKLMPALTPREEVQPEPVQEEKKMSKRESIKAALEYSIAHPSETLVNVAKMYGITTSDIYNARHLHKKRLLKGAKKVKSAPSTWKQASVSTSAEPVKQDVVNHPAHYKTGGIECIDAIAAITKDLRGLEAVCTANALKYLWRWKKKGGVESLKKANWYILKLVNSLEGTSDGEET